MKNPLKSLDDLVLKGHQKVADAAYKKLGWSKWDLADVANKAAFVGYEGVFTYAGIQASLQGNGTAMGIYAFQVILGGFLYWSQRDSNRRQEDREKNFLMKENVVHPKGLYSRYLRPYLTPLVAGVAVAYVPQLVMGTTTIPEIMPPSNPQSYAAAEKLGFAAYLGWALGFTAMSYFRDCLPKPPAKQKKKLWRAALDYITSPFRKSIAQPELQPQEIANGEYRSLENALKSEIILKNEIKRKSLNYMGG